MKGLRDSLRATEPSKHIMVLRLVAAVPLIAIGAGHLVDPEPFVAVLEAAGLPLVGVSSVMAPVVEIVAGLLLLLGLYARIGGALATSTMMAALYAHAVIDPSALPESVAMPPIVLPLAVLVAAIYVTGRGAGAWSLDRSAREMKLEEGGSTSASATSATDSPLSPEASTNGA